MSIKVHLRIGKNVQLENGRKMHLRIGKKIQLQNGNNSKWKMNNGKKVR